MANKFVRGITDIKTITKQGFDTNNVNDLLSDGEHSYIHRKKKDGTEEYHCLTDNIKTIKNADADLLTVSSNTDNNTVTLTVKHDASKQDRLTPGNGITINENNIITCNVSTMVLSSPNGTAYNLSVTDEGVLQATPVSETV